MNPTNAVVLTGVLVVVGNWAQGKDLNIRIAIGVAALAFFLAAMNSARPDLAGKFATLILVGAVFVYALPIARKLGYTKR